MWTHSMSLNVANTIHIRFKFFKDLCNFVTYLIAGLKITEQKIRVYTHLKELNHGLDFVSELNLVPPGLTYQL